MITRRLSLSMIMMMALVALVLTSFFSPIDSFTVVPQQYARAPSKNQVSSTTQLFFFGGPKDDGSPGDYVCKVSVEFNKCLTFTSNQIRAILRRMLTKSDHVNSFLMHKSASTRRTVDMFLPKDPRRGQPYRPTGRVHPARHPNIALPRFPKDRRRARYK